MKFILFPFFLLQISAFGSLFSQSYTPETVPNPTKTVNGYLSNPDKILSVQSETKINRLLLELERTTSIEFSIVILNSISGLPSKDFAVSLFEKWGIGKKGKDNGLLLLIALQERRWEFETGYGLEGILPDIKLKQTGERLLVPALRSKDYETGLTEVIAEISRLVEVGEETEEEARLRIESEQKETVEWIEAYNQKIEYWTSPWFNALFFVYGVFSYGILFLLVRNSPNHPLEQTSPETGDLHWRAFFLFSTIPIICAILICFHLEFVNIETILIFWSYAIPFLALDIFQILKQVEKSVGESPYKKYVALHLFAFHDFMFFLVLIFPIPILLFFPLVFIRKKILRHTPRNSPKTGKPLICLSEDKEDIFLKEGQKLEEQIGSVDYDVWVTEDETEVYVHAYDAMFTKYSKCSKCNHKTNYVSESETLASATCHSSGEGKRIYLCKNCSHTYSEKYTIPRRNCETKTSSGSSSFGSSSRSSSSSSSSSSFGGGRSGGGGAGGSW